ncbi:MlaD family protein [Flavobacterium aquatile]|uniref:Organic solvent ABC transporter substrate-binding protein n=1 Tax=Flavobacterium aquatile LMG 4008 = ATCC 11947 TaxID=1453498 RepID=A0A095ST83_9FLAO|nr:MlaD family protein [Flavobacterium aquatile]KGD67866.1 organic solvent ABC transporter substrate-binding protein [Flavobacterium aquatile LMG 4008 = ATCC 11947]OXA67728.1 organic solvent ABC transporter substrate-binding protein [Flavobacterium aquatile LMG 4008 = ATCC 11947]GEC80004.1 organic solvent ABC transporter substrate-binding protein [Flavobacterium aquatile]
MKISREIKTAILVISAILLFIWGYSFLKGRDLFTDYKTFYVEYDNVEGLAPSAPVTLNGLTIGKVNTIKINNKTGKLLVEMQLKSDFPISKTSAAELYAPSLVGGKQIAIIPNTADTSVAETGDYLKASNKMGLTDSLAMKMEPLTDKIDKLLENANIMITNVNQVLDAKTKENLRSSLANLNQVMAEFKEVAKSTNSMLAENKSKIGSTMTNVEKASANFSKVSDSLAKINLGPTVKSLEKTMANVDKMMAELESGKGTMGKLLKDETMYNNFTKTSKELELLLQDLRLNPTRYVNVSLFGKKNKPYVAPKNDTIK